MLARVGGKEVVCRLQLLELGTSLGLATGMQLAGDTTRQRQPRRKRPEASRLAGLLSLWRLLQQGQQGNGLRALLWA